MNADKIREVMKASTSGNKMARIYRALEAVVVECVSPVPGNTSDATAGAMAQARKIMQVIARELGVIDE